MGILTGVKNDDSQFYSNKNVYSARKKYVDEFMSNVVEELSLICVNAIFFYSIFSSVYLRLLFNIQFYDDESKLWISSVC